MCTCRIFQALASALDSDGGEFYKKVKKSADIKKKIFMSETVSSDAELITVNF